MTKERSVEFLLGLFVLAGIAAMAYLAIHLGAGNFLHKDTYLIEARFANVGGLNKGGSVLLAGVSIGRVESIRIDPSDFSAIVTLRILHNVRLPADTMASIKTSGLIGDKYVSLLPGADDATLQPGDRIVLTESAVDLESLIGKLAFGSVQDSTTQPPNSLEKNPTAPESNAPNLAEPSHPASNPLAEPQDSIPISLDQPHAPCDSSFSDQSIPNLTPHPSTTPEPSLLLAPEPPPNLDDQP